MKRSQRTPKARPAQESWSRAAVLSRSRAGNAVLTGKGGGGQEGNRGAPHAFSHSKDFELVCAPELGDSRTRPEKLDRFESKGFGSEQQGPLDHQFTSWIRLSWLATFSRRWTRSGRRQPGRARRRWW